ncbi:uncharacterized protein LOC126835921 [Adelges cooleyi]|uniref:uncharacterized protein LOC126835921 n=1 Tax=Adelges cooleyi TaxID=133065 RepID=UPI00217FAD65|nr:uncharacterized protein LOC126835921 [Adelges cooleyi]
MFFGALFKLTAEKTILSLDMGLELILYAVVGFIQTLIITSFFFNKRAIALTFRSMQTTFVDWSLKRRVHPDNCYDKSETFLFYTMIGTTICIICIMLGPVLSAIYDIGNVPLDHRSHWILHWPTVINIDTFWRYGLIITLQMTATTYLLLSVALYSMYTIAFLTELKEQFKLLTNGIREAFHYRMDQHFQVYFVDSVRHHQTLMNTLNEFKKYNKWILFGEIATVEMVFLLATYCLIKVDASFGYKLKFIGILVFWIAMLWSQCTLGDDIIYLHKSLSTELYCMTWYNMPNHYKKNIIVMFQRTQRDLYLNSAIFQNRIAYERQ